MLLTITLQFLDEDHQLPLAVLLFLAVRCSSRSSAACCRRCWPPWSGSCALNWFFTPPVGRLTIAEPTNLVALLVYVAVAAGVATVVDRASRRGSEAARARAEAATLATLSQSVLTGQDTAEAIVERLRETFGQRSVALLARDGPGWRVVAADGPEPGDGPEEADSRVTVDDDHVLALRGVPLRASDQRVLEGFAVQTGLVLEYRRLRERENRTAALERADATSTAILRAVSHDLRTPLATMRTAVDGLVSGGEALDDDDRRVLVEAVDSATDQLEHLIDNLLDLSRLQTGLLHPVLTPRSLEEILPIAVSGHPPGASCSSSRSRHPLVIDRRRAARAGRRQPRVERGPGVPGHAGPRPRPRCWPTRCPSWSSTVAPASRRTGGSGCSSRSSESTTPGPAVSVSASRWHAG